MPEQFSGSNNWRIFFDEEVTGLDGKKIVGPLMVRIDEYPGEKPEETITVITYNDQNNQQRLEVNGDFVSSVQKISSDTLIQ